MNLWTCDTERFLKIDIFAFKSNKKNAVKVTRSCHPYHTHPPLLHFRTDFFLFLYPHSPLYWCILQYFDIYTHVDPLTMPCLTKTHWLRSWDQTQNVYYVDMEIKQTSQISATNICFWERWYRPFLDIKSLTILSNFSFIRILRGRISYQRTVIFIWLL